MKELKAVGKVLTVFVFLFAGPLFMAHNERLSAMSMDLSAYTTNSTMRGDTFYDYCEYPFLMGIVEHHASGGYYINMGDQFWCWNDWNADTAAQRYATQVFNQSPPFVAADSAEYIERTLWTEDPYSGPTLGYCFGDSQECQDIWVDECYDDAWLTYSLFSSSLGWLKDGELLPERYDITYYDGPCP